MASKTVASSASAYCTAADFLVRYDTRSVAELLSDTGTAVASGDVEANTKLATILRQASGKVEAAVFLGGKYDKEDLEALEASGTNGSQMLAGLVCDIAFGILVRRRPDAEMPVPPQCQEAEEMLGALAAGEEIFPFTETKEAGQATVETDTPADVEARNQPSYQARGMWGTRQNRRTV
jgi:hypothetical protein